MIEPPPRPKYSPVAKFFRTLGFFLFLILALIFAYIGAEQQNWIALIVVLVFLLMCFICRPNKTKVTIIDVVGEAIFSILWEVIVFIPRLILKGFDS